jgi:transposase
VKDRSVAAPSYEQLAALVAAQERTIAQLQARIAEQDAEIAELKRRLAASSRNSSQPPSSEGWTSRRPNRCAAGPAASRAGSQDGKGARCGRSRSPMR